MSFRRYEKYKDSGVEWLREVPEHWTFGAVKHFVAPRRDAIKTGPFGSHLTSHEMQSGSIKVYNQRNVIDDDFEDGDSFISEEKFAELTAFETFPGDLLVTTRGTIGRAAVLPSGATRGILHPCLLRVQSDQCKLLTDFLKALIQDSDLLRTQLNYLSNATTIEVIYSNTIASVIIPVPPIHEQQAILKFLDQETAKIDGLVGEQRRLIELLKEKRQAVISHAVTKGLNPNAKLKPSGIDWLGDVPEHWKVGNAGFYMRMLSGFAFPSAGFSDNAEDVRLLRGINVGVGRIKWDETVYWKRAANDDLDEYELGAGDLVIGMDRPWISEGVRVARITEDDLPCLLLQRVASLKTGLQLNAAYLMHLLALEDVFNAHFAPDTTGVSVPHISPEQIRDYEIPVPPITEQEEIVRHIGCEIAKLDALTAEAERAIGLLQERRTALISAAVTGKIDVRGLSGRKID